jgi:hypothetical protein
VRVFASEMTEVWDLLIKDAAERLGDNFNGGSIFFIWVYASGHGKTAVPATWGKVFDDLPTWMKQASDRSAVGAPGTRARPDSASAPRRPPG